MNSMTKEAIISGAVYNFTIDELSYKTVRSVMKEIRALADVNNNLILNFEHVAFLDSHALLFVLAINTEMNAKKGALQLENLSSTLEEILSLTRSDTVLELV